MVLPFIENEPFKGLCRLLAISYACFWAGCTFLPPLSPPSRIFKWAIFVGETSRLPSSIAIFDYRRLPSSIAILACHPRFPFSIAIPDSHPRLSSSIAIRLYCHSRLPLSIAILDCHPRLPSSVSPRLRLRAPPSESWSTGHHHKSQSVPDIKPEFSRD